MVFAWYGGHKKESKLDVHKLLKVLQLKIHIFWNFIDIMFSWIGFEKWNKILKSWILKKNHSFSLNRCTLIML